MRQEWWGMHCFSRRLPVLVKAHYLVCPDARSIMQLPLFRCCLPSAVRGVACTGQHQALQDASACTPAASVKLMYSPQPTPKRIAAFGDRKVERVACGHQHTLAITGDGAGFTWGEGSDRAELRPSPVAVRPAALCCWGAHWHVGACIFFWQWPTLSCPPQACGILCVVTSAFA